MAKDLRQRQAARAEAEKAFAPLLGWQDDDMVYVVGEHAERLAAECGAWLKDAEGAAAGRGEAAADAPHESGTLAAARALKAGKDEEGYPRVTLTTRQWNVLGNALAARGVNKVLLDAREQQQP